jgi:formylglycine-generating enzyme required for sulfatase activity
MVRIPAGCFQMGSPAGETNRDSDERLHRVCVEAFEMGKTEVTFAQWDACVADGGCGGYRPPDNGWGRGRRPVINVSWHDARAYAVWLSRKTGQSWRLPTEAEWEYAARAGTTGPFSFQGPITWEKVNYDARYQYEGSPKGEYRAKTVPVGSLPANAWGLHEVHGNVWEWTCSGNDKDYGGGETRCAEVGEAGNRVLRGGSWINDPWYVRSANRNGNTPDYRNYDYGFRLARTLP